jgi:hypothetical protein
MRCLSVSRLRAADEDLAQIRLMTWDGVFSSPTAQFRLLMTPSPTPTVGLRAVYSRSVAPCHDERVAMYNQLADREADHRAYGEGFNSAGIQYRTTYRN